MVVSHSNLALEDSDGMVVQQTVDENNESQLWVLARGDKSRHYKLQNFKTKKYYCPSTTLLDTVVTKTTPCEIRIENASKEKGYYLFADYDSDYMADVLNVSKDVGMPLITWVRTGTDNQKIKLVKAELPQENPPVGLEREHVAGASLAKTMGWTVFDANGVVVHRGYGHEINAKNMRPGAYFVRSGSMSSRVILTP